jgi:F-type H+-transporting ATPase subunit b
MLNLIIASVLNFGILVFLLFKFVVPKISEAMDKKQQGIIHSVEEAEKNLADINQELESHKRQMAVVEQEIASIRQEAEARGVAAASKIETDTVREIEALRVRMERQIEQEFHNLKLRLKADLVNQVMATAQEMAGQRLDQKGHSSLVEDFAFSLKDFKEFKS